MNQTTALELAENRLHGALELSKTAGYWRSSSPTVSSLAFTLLKVGMQKA